MDFQNYWLTLILLTILAFPLWYFLKDMRWFIDELKFMIPAIFISGTVYLIINFRLSELAVIQYNENFLIGKKLFWVPVEEWLFVVVFSLVLFAVYNRLKERYASLDHPNLFMVVALCITVILIVSAWLSKQKLYPFTIFALSAVYLGYTVFRNRFKHHLTKFFVTWFVLVIPLFLIRVFLFSMPVLIADNNFTSGINLINTPVEDLAFIFLLVLMNITVYEYIRERRFF